MNRLALFVEGYTELIFVEKLIEEMAGRNKVRIELRRIRGGVSTRRKLTVMKAAKVDTGQKYFVLIVDCGGDHQVKSRILEEHQNLTKKGYTKIYGIRDVRPQFTHADIPKLEMGLRKYVKTSLAPVEFILAIMEIEAWFLAEVSHYAKIDPAITLPAIKEQFGFDPENDDLEQRCAPAEDLKNCYAIGGRTYVKHRAQETVDALDYTRIYLELCNKFRYLAQLVNGVEAFLTM